jgi:hypothetical protein
MKMKLASASVLLILICASTLSSEPGETPSDKRRRELILKAESMLGEDRQAVEKLFGKPADVQGEGSGNKWFYGLPVRDTDVTRIDGFQVLFHKDRVFAVMPHYVESVFLDGNVNLGTYAMHIGKDAAEAEFLESFLFSKAIGALRREQRLVLLKVMHGSIKQAIAKRQQSRVRVNCDFGKLWLSIADEFHTPVKVEKVDGIERIDLIAAIDQVAGAVERLKD